MSSCLEALLKLYPYMDGELPETEAEEVRRHFELCPPCAPAYTYFRNFRNALHRAGTQQPGAPAQLHQRIAELLDRADPTGSQPQ